MHSIQIYTSPICSWSRFDPRKTCTYCVLCVHHKNIVCHYHLMGLLIRNVKWLLLYLEFSCSLDDVPRCIWNTGTWLHATLKLDFIRKQKFHSEVLLKGYRTYLVPHLNSCYGRGALSCNRSASLNTSFVSKMERLEAGILTRGDEISSDMWDFKTFFFFSEIRGFTKIT